ncbi:MAG: hypothetical protein LBE67_17575 [Kocuria palustris]|jgi:hypothetical protein|nr:hypothetical protein [Kocuria palustris]
MNVLRADTFKIGLGPLRCSDGRELGDEVILACLIQRLELRGVGMSQMMEVKRIRDDAFQTLACINCRGSIESTISAVSSWLALTVIGMAGATAKHLSLRPCLLTIGLIFLVQRGDDVDLATLSTQDAASPRQKGPGRLVLLIGAESQ